MNAGLIVAAGRNPSMAQNVDRAFLSLGTKPVLAFSMQAFEKCPDIDIVVVVARKDRVDATYAVSQMFGCSKVKKVVAGAADRQGSVALGLAQINDDVRIVTVHDASRPCVTPDMISQTVKSAKRYGSGVTGLKVPVAVKHVDKGQIVTKTLDRSKLWLTETPQSFKIEVLRKGLEAAKRKRVTLSDDSEAVELVSKEVHLVPSTIPNIAIATADDLALAGAVLRI